ncbi:MAG: SGNH/GDSL hydrolase family protein [Elusimicrobia bacterium]|nr:SGNH/GDSL hydrolase family protein [Elusimicrobiota bacterium]
MEKFGFLKDIFFKCCIAGVSFILCLIFLEIGIRIFTDQPYYGYPKDLFRNDKELGYSLTPNFEGMHIQPEFKVKYHINSQGFRDEEVSEQKFYSSKRILLLGDSVAFGLCVRMNQSWAYLLEKKINEKTKNRYIIINTGVPGYGQEEEIKFFKTRGKKLNPDIVLTQFCWNDLGHNILYSVQNGYLSAFREGTVSKVKIFLNLHSRLYTFIVLRIKSSKWWQRKRRDRRLLLAPQFVTDSRIEERFKITENYLIELDKEIKSTGAKHYIVLIPDKDFINLKRMEYLTAAFLELCKKLDISVINLYPEFKSHFEKGENLYFKIDPHWNEEGNRVAADVIYRKLINKLKI